MLSLAYHTYILLLLALLMPVESHKAHGYHEVLERLKHDLRDLCKPAEGVLKVARYRDLQDRLSNEDDGVREGE